MEQTQPSPPTRPENFAYVLGVGAITPGVLSVVDLDTNSTVYNLPLVSTANSVAIAPNGSLAYVTDSRGLVWAVDTEVYAVNGPILVGTDPVALAFSPDGATAYVANADAGTVSVIDTSTASVTDTISVGANPRGVAFAADGTRAYVAVDGSLVILDAATHTALDTIATGVEAGPVAVAHDGSAVYVALSSSNGVLIFDTATHSIAKVDLPGHALDLAVSSDDGTVYVVAGAAIYAIDTASKALRKTIALPSVARRMALTPDGAALLVTNAPSQGLSRISTATEQVEVTIEEGIGADPGGVSAVSAPVPTGPSPAPTPTRTPASGVFAYVGSEQADLVTAINANSGKIAALIPTDFQQPIAASADGRTLYVGGGPTTDVIDTRTNAVIETFVPDSTASVSSIAFSPDGEKAYILTGSSRLFVFDTATHTPLTSVPVPHAHRFALSPSGDTAYVTSSSPPALQVVDTATVTTSSPIPLPAGGYPLAIAIHPTQALAYVTDYNQAALYVVNTSTRSTDATVALGDLPIDVKVTPDGQRVYVIENGANDVAVIDATTNAIVTHIPVGTQPFAIGFTPDGGRAYVANYGSNTVSVIGAQTLTVEDTIAAPTLPVSVVVVDVPSS